MPDSLLLALIQFVVMAQDRGHVTVKDCADWLSEGDNGRDKLAEFFRERFRERYIEPFLRLKTSEKNGFSIMAISCLLIEAFESFRQGWESTEGKGMSARAFSLFFSRETRFDAFKKHAGEFYKNVRCGILHQGETTGGWTIVRENDLFDPAQRRINATKFHSLLGEVIDEYAGALKQFPLSSEEWTKFRMKMYSVIRNCEK